MQDRWGRINDLFALVVAASAERQDALLNEACGDDSELRAEVASLVAAHHRAGAFLATPAVRAGDLLPHPSLAGRQLGAYRIEREIGRGGMGVVYLAEDTRLKRQVALKVIPPECRTDPARRDRLRLEAQAAAALTHPSIATVYALEEIGDELFIVSEYVQGQTLRALLANGAFALGELLPLAVAIAGGLQAAHGHGVVHRDLKPENVIRTDDGRVKILDFGIANVAVGAGESAIQTRTGVVLGTPGYMAPEQLEGESVDFRADIFAFGVLLYELATGENPFGTATPVATIARTLAANPVPLVERPARHPAELGRIVAKCLQKRPEDRYKATATLVHDLERLQNETSRASTGTGRWWWALRERVLRAGHRGRVVVEAGRRRHVWPVLGACAVAAVSVGVFVLLSGRRVPALTDRDVIMVADWVNETGDRIFDEALKPALAVKLEESPFLKLLSDEQVRAALGYMGKKADERLTPAIAREVCQRQNVKALLVPTIAALGTRYPITFEVTDCVNGRVLTSELVEAAGKDGVVDAVGRAASRIRQTLGESLASLDRFDVPLRQATTASLDALKVFSQGEALFSRSFDVPGALAAYERAIQLDPEFGMAYCRAQKMIAFMVLSDPKLNSRAREYKRRALELRDRVSENEKFELSFLGDDPDFSRAMEQAQLWTKTYPRSYDAHAQLSEFCSFSGSWECSVAEAIEANRLEPAAVDPLVKMYNGYIALERFADARSVAERTLSLNPVYGHLMLYEFAMKTGDQASVERELQWAAGKPEEVNLLASRYALLTRAGRFRAATSALQRAIDITKRYRRREGGYQQGIFVNTDMFDLWMAATRALFGWSRLASVDAAKLARSNLGPSAALALALAGADAESESAMTSLPALGGSEEAAVSHPWWITRITLPRSIIMLHRGRPREAIDLLECARPYEMGMFDGLMSTYVRGQAYHALGRYQEAAGEYERIVSYRRLLTFSTSMFPELYPLAHVRLARARAMSGDAAGARQAYEKFFDLWKNADTDIPILIAARREYEKLVAG